LPDIVAEVTAAFEGYEGAVVSQDVGMLPPMRRPPAHLVGVIREHKENIKARRKTNCAVWTPGTMSNSQVLST
jgi:hypothetical protein